MMAVFLKIEYIIPRYVPIKFDKKNFIHDLSFMYVSTICIDSMTVCSKSIFPCLVNISLPFLISKWVEGSASVVSCFTLF